MSIHLNLLNEQQQQAVTQTQGPYIINAGPGAGKTQVLTYRIAYLIQEKKIPPYQVIALTFTNKAAKEMLSRIQKLLQNNIKGLWIGTFHSLFAHLLRIEAHTINLSKNFTIYDRTDSLNLIKTIIKELQLNDEIYKPTIILNRISTAKNLLIDAKAYSQNQVCLQDDQKAAKPHMAKIYLQYQARCKQASALDFDDLLLTTYQLLSQHKELAQKYQERFQYILVDEFQDTNQAQYAILKILAKHQNLCVIGDDAQSIYAFRGAKIDHMLSFKKHFNNAQVIKLEQSYRFTKRIAQAAYSLIQHNKQQLPKKIFTNNPEGAPISLIQHINETEEAKYVAQSIFETSQTKQLTYNNFTILYRTNSQSRIFEEELRKNQIPYQILGGISFYQKKEIKDLLGYLRLLVNPNDEQALRRVINLPKRGIGPTTLEKITQWSITHQLTLWQVLEKIHEFIQGNTAKAIEGFVGLINEIKEKVTSEDAYTLATEIAKRSGLLQNLYQNQTPEGISRYENIQELLNSIKSYSDQHKNAEDSLANFLQQIALVSQTDQEDEKNTPKVSLMTIHMAKGLEFPYVYIVGMEESLFPTAQATQDELQEERRLFYVALTRAKAKIHLTYAKTRYRFGQQKACKASRFLQEIDPNCLQVTQQPSSPVAKKEKNTTVTYPTTKNYTRLQYLQHEQPTNPALLKQVKVNQKIKHPVFGIGKITRIIPEKPYEKVVIDFEKRGKKTLLLHFASLQAI